MKIFNAGQFKINHVAGIIKMTKHIEIAIARLDLGGELKITHLPLSI